MRKPVCAICKQQRHRSACASAQSDQRLCCLLLGYYNTSTCYSRNFKTLASLISWAGRFESYLVANPKDRFSRDVAHIMVLMNRTWNLFVFWVCLMEAVHWTNELAHDKTNKLTCAPSKDSDQPGHPPSLIRVFAVRMKKPWVLGYP